MTVGYKKLTKIAILILSSLIIATVSAATYRYMYIDGSVTVGSPLLIWIKGLDAPGDSAVSGSTYTVDLDVEPGTPQTFIECVFLKNEDTAAHNMTISVTTTISATDFTVCNMLIYENSTASWLLVDTLDITTSDSYNTRTLNDPLGIGGYYRMTFEVSPTIGASGSYDFDLQVEYE